MSDDIEWLSITTLGSRYEQQVSTCGRFWRHRLMSTAAFRRGKVSACAFAVETTWRPGRAPDGAGQGNTPRTGEQS